MAKVYDTATDLITFARSSSGTALRRVGYGDELVTNGGFDTDTDWDLLRMYIDESGGTLNFGSEWGANRATSTLNVVAGKTYSSTITCNAAGIGANLFIYVNGVLQEFFPTIPSDTTQAETIVFRATQSGPIELRATSTGAVNNSWDNFSVKEVIFDRPSDDLVLFNHPDDIPRIEYGSDGSLKGLLIEEQRTNLITNSTPQSGDLATSGGSFSYVTCNFTPLSGPGIHFDTTGVTSYVYFRPTHTVDDYTFSVFVEMNDGNAPTFGSSISPDASNDFAFVIDGGPVNPASYIVEHYGGSTYRVSGTRPSVNTTVRNAGLIKYSGNSSRTFKVTGFQFEQGSFPTSYIPTSGGQKTRDPDIASIPVTAFGYNQQAGTVVVEASRLAAISGDYNSILCIGTDGSNRIDLGTINDDGYQSINFAGPEVVGYNNGQPHNRNIYAAGVYSTAGLAFKLNSANAAVNGAIGAEDTSCTIPTVTQVKIGNDFSSRYLNGHIKSLSYFPRRLTDAQLQELTS